LRIGLVSASLARSRPTSTSLLRWNAASLREMPVTAAACSRVTGCPAARMKEYIRWRSPSSSATDRLHSWVAVGETVGGVAVAGALEQAKRPVSAALAGPYGHPWHPILATVPIGAWVASLVFDVGSRVVTGGGFLARGSLWLIAIGVLGALAAALLGFLDLFAIPTVLRRFVPP
jgi:hypothetical protein